MAPTEAVDELFEVKNAFYLGNYQQCINEAQKLHPKNEDVKLIRDAFLFRAYIAQKKFTVPLNEISQSAPLGLKTVRLYAEFLAHDSKRRRILEDLEAQTNAGVAAGEDLFFLMAAFIFMGDENYDSALRMLNQAEDLEAAALTIQCLLKIDRVELAVKELKRMQEKDEDATVTQLATAWVNLAVGKDKLQDAFYIYQEMMDKYGETPLLLVGQTTCLLMQGKYEAAESPLQDALQRDPNNPDAIINSIILTQMLGKPFEQSNRFVSQLKDGHPDHPWTRDFEAAEKLFDRIAQEA